MTDRTVTPALLEVLERELVEEHWLALRMRDLINEIRRLHGWMDCMADSLSAGHPVQMMLAAAGDGEPAPEEEKP